MCRSRLRSPSTSAPHAARNSARTNRTRPQATPKMITSTPSTPIPKLAWCRYSISLPDWSEGRRNPYKSGEVVGKRPRLLCRGEGRNISLRRDPAHLRNAAGQGLQHIDVALQPQSDAGGKRKGCRQGVAVLCAGLACPGDGADHPVGSDLANAIVQGISEIGR